MAAYHARRTHELLVNFADKLPIIPEQEAQEMAEYSSKYKLRRIKTTEDDRELLYIDTYSDTFRINGVDVLALL